MRSLIVTSLLGLAVVLAGCQTPHSYPMPDATWQAHVGQLKYSNRKRTLIGDVVVQQRGNDEFQLDFIKGGGLPLLSLREDAASARVEGLLVRGSWQGAPDAAPRAFQAWMKLRPAFAHPPAPGGSKASHAEARYSGGQLTMLFLAFPYDDQRFVFQFNR